jgi:hypothetical protein
MYDVRSTFTVFILEVCMCSMCIKIRNEAVKKQCDAVEDRDEIIDDDYIRGSGVE